MKRDEFLAVYTRPQEAYKDPTVNAEIKRRRIKTLQENWFHSTITSEIYYGKIKLEKIATWQINEDPFDILEENYVAEKFNGWYYLSDEDNCAIIFIEIY